MSQLMAGRRHVTHLFKESDLSVFFEEPSNKTQGRRATERGSLLGDCGCCGPDTCAQNLLSLTTAP